MNAYYLNNNYDSNLNNNHVYNYLVCDHKVHDCVRLKKKKKNTLTGITGPDHFFVIANQAALCQATM